MTLLIPAELGSVRVRHVRKSDHEAYVALESDPIVRRFVNGPTSKSPAAIRFALENQMPSTKLLAIADSESDLFFGRCGVLPTKNSADAEVYVLLNLEAQGRGIGQIVFRFLLDLAKSEGCRPIALVHPENMPSRVVMERLGLVCTGSVAESTYQDGHLRYETDG